MTWLDPHYALGRDAEVLVNAFSCDLPADKGARRPAETLKVLPDVAVVLKVRRVELRHVAGGPEVQFVAPSELSLAVNSAAVGKGLPSSPLGTPAKRRLRFSFN